MLPTLKLLAVIVELVPAFIEFPFTTTPPMVTPEPLVFSWIVFTSKVPEIWVFPVWPSTNNPILPWFFTSKSTQLTCPEAEIIFLLPTS